MSIQYPVIGSTDWGNAINDNFSELDTRVNENLNKIGDLTTLTTTDKTSLVNAIKENTTSLSDVAHKTGTVQTNLNADLLDGQHGSYYAPLASPNFTGTPKINSNSIVTATLPTEFAITGLNGFSVAGGSKATYFKTQEGIVVVNAFLTASTPQSISGTVIFNLPTGYRPNTAVRVVGFYNETTPVEILITTSGVVNINATITNVNSIFFYITFEGAN
jgi:hypothetical protein